MSYYHKMLNFAGIKTGVESGSPDCPETSAPIAQIYSPRLKQTIDVFAKQGESKQHAIARVRRHHQ